MARFGDVFGNLHCARSHNKIPYEVVVFARTEARLRQTEGRRQSRYIDLDKDITAEMIEAGKALRKAWVERYPTTPLTRAMITAILEEGKTMEELLS